MARLLSKEKYEKEDRAEILVGQFMLALPGFQSADFQETIILICQHDETGAMGVVINQPISGIHMADIGEKTSDLSDRIGPNLLEETPIFWGGSTQVNQGFMLHSPEVSWATTVRISNSLSITAHWDVLAEISDQQNAWPEQYRMILGHVAWRPGQLEKEWMQQAWLLLPYQEHFVFDIDPEQQWGVMMAAYGIHPMTLASVQGRA